MSDFTLKSHTYNKNMNISNAWLQKDDETKAHVSGKATVTDCKNWAYALPPWTISLLFKTDVQLAFGSISLSWK